MTPPWSLLALMALAACSSNLVALPELRCTPGTSGACSCASRSGTRLCNNDGWWGVCRCPDADAGAVADRPGTDAQTADRVDASFSWATVRTGQRCASIADCPDDQDCAMTPHGRVCTIVCSQDTDAVEQDQCGGRGTTCLLYGPQPTGRVDICVRGCVPSARSELTGACPPGYVCTTNWYQQSSSTAERTPGCLPRCTTDAHCVGVDLGDGGAMRCNVRTGICSAAGVNLALRVDGAACDPSSRIPQCRGICFRVSTTSTTWGICGSFIDLRATTECPDSPDVVAPRAMAGDNLAVCIFRACQHNAECGAGLLCVRPEEAGAVRMDLDPICYFPSILQPNGIP